MMREQMLEAALRELTEVAKRAVRLSVQYPDFSLPAIEPMDRAIAAADAALAAPATAQDDALFHAYALGVHDQAATKEKLDPRKTWPMHAGEFPAAAQEAPVWQEPVAWRVRVLGDDPEEWVLFKAGAGVDYLERKNYEAQPLYLHPLNAATPSPPCAPSWRRRWTARP
jgi:hypothetical protein